MSKVTVDHAPSDKAAHPVFAELDEIGEKVRERAHRLFEHRGFGDGHAIDDWLTAERQICWPAAELEEREDDFRLQVALAGFEPEDIKVTAMPGDIVIKAAHEEHTKGKGAKPLWSEFRSNHVLRRVAMPTAIDTDKVKAKFKRGMLTIKAGKSTAAKTPADHGKSAKSAKSRKSTKHSSEIEVTASN